MIALRNRKDLLWQGEAAFSYMIWYSVGIFFIEGMRTDSLWIGDLLRVSRGLSLILFTGAIGICIYLRRDYPIKSYYLEGWRLKKE
ncbi:prolipoprotein diacylglyceryl transferase [Carnobacterium viridans]|nr:prolipoprotein diacylglyceryl transferase [Carnobacterium viridans]